MYIQKTEKQKRASIDLTFNLMGKVNENNRSPYFYDNQSRFIVKLECYPHTYDQPAIF